jgi:hypothetical protein
LNIIEGGNNVFDALAYGIDRPVSTMDYFQQEINNISNTLSEAGKGFFSNVQTLYNNINNSEALRIARNAIQNAASLFKPDTILPLSTLEHLQSAGLVMQRYLMANPVVREAYHAQRIDGYSDTYIDLSPNVVGNEHYDYRRVMNAVVQSDAKDDSWFVQYYPDELLDGDRELSHDEKVDVIKSWDLAEMFIRAGDNDPTSVYGSKM